MGDDTSRFDINRKSLYRTLQLHQRFPKKCNEDKEGGGYRGRCMKTAEAKTKHPTRIEKPTKREERAGKFRKARPDPAEENCAPPR